MWPQVRAKPQALIWSSLVSWPTDINTEPSCNRVTDADRALNGSLGLGIVRLQVAMSVIHISLFLPALESSVPLLSTVHHTPVHHGSTSPPWGTRIMGHQTALWLSSAHPGNGEEFFKFIKESNFFSDMLALPWFVMFTNIHIVQRVVNSSL